MTRARGVLGSLDGPSTRTAAAFALVYAASAILVTAVIAGAGGAQARVWSPVAGLSFAFLCLVGWRGVLVVVVTRYACGLLAYPELASEHPAGALMWDVGVAVVYALAAQGLRRTWRPEVSPGALAWFLLWGVLIAPLGAAAFAAGLASAADVEVADSTWARLTLSDAVAVATLAPGALLLGLTLTGAVRPRPLTAGPRTRLKALAQAPVVLIGPLLLVAVHDVGTGELLLLPLAVLPLVWVALRADLLRTGAAMAVSSLVLAAIGASRYEAPGEIALLQSAMLAGALATMVVLASLATDARARRAQEVAASRWRTLVAAASAVVVAHRSTDGTWRLESVDPDGGGAEVLARLRTVPEVAAAAESRTARSVPWVWDVEGGSARWFVTQVAPLGGRDVLTVTTETTQALRAEAALAWERTHDRDSGLPNRDVLLATADDAIGGGGESGGEGGGEGGGELRDDPGDDAPACVVVIDLAAVSRTAQLVGHDDARLLADAARRCADTVADVTGLGPGTLVARTGEQQVGLLVPGALPSAVATAERLLASLSPSPRAPLAPRCSLGVAPLEPRRPALEALRRAGIAAQAATERSAGTSRGGVVVYDALVATTAAERERLLSRVRAAVEAEELEVVYQPDVHLPSGTLCGVEALVRWRRRDGYATSTELFIRLAEETGAVTQVDSWVREHAVAQLGRWRREGGRDTLELGLNVSAHSLAPGLAEHLLECCARHDVPPSKVRMEITETALAEERRATSVVREVRDAGFRVALDDFGTGYASLSRLSRLPVDLIKLDRSFVSPLTADPASRAVVGFVLGLAERLAVDVVVEGVETTEQRDVLLDMGCRRAQGFLFARPAAADVLRDVLRDGVAGPMEGSAALP